MNSSPFKHKSLTKNWPGGRRTSTILTSISHGGSALLWNTVVASFKRPYCPPKPAPSQGGMANPSTENN